MFQFLYILMLCFGAQETRRKKKKKELQALFNSVLGIKRRVTDIKRKGAE